MLRYGWPQSPSSEILCVRKRAPGTGNIFSEKLPKQKAIPKSLQNGSGFRRFGQRFQDRIQNADPILKVD